VKKIFTLTGRKEKREEKKREAKELKKMEKKRFRGKNKIPNYQDKVNVTKKETLKRFQGIIFSRLEKQGKLDLISLIKTDLKNIDSELTNKELNEDLSNILYIRLGWNSLNRKEFIKEISYPKRLPRRESLGKNRFFKVRGGRPVQGGSPGLGKGKS